MIETFGEKDKVLVRYLFNELTEDEAVELEDEMLLDDALHDRMQVVEMNLIDGYVRRELPPEESLRFQEKFLAVPENRDKVTHAQMFHNSLRLLHEEEAVPAAPSPAPPPRRRDWRQPLVALFSRPSPAAAFAALALLLAFALVAWFVLRPRPDKTSPVVVNPTPPAPVNVNLPVNVPPDNPVAVNASPAPQTPPVIPSPDRGPNSRGLEIATNVPAKETQWRCLRCRNQYGAERGAGKETRITLRRGAKYLRLAYELLDDAPKRETFTVKIEDEDNRPVTLKNNKKEEEAKPRKSRGRTLITVSVPTSVLKDGGRYTFRIDDPYFPPTAFTIKK